MASQRQINVGGVPIGGGAPVAVQTMTKTETANLQATMDQIRRVAEAGADIVRVAVPRDKDVEALKTIVRESPIPIIADIHFNHTLALKAIDAGAHCVRLNPGNIGGPDKVAEVAERANAAGTPMRIGVNSGSLPKHLHALERENPVEALVTAAVEFVELMERLDFEDFKVSIKSTNVPNTIASNRLLSERIPYPLHLGITEAGTKWSGSLKSAVGLGTLLADGDRRHDPHLALHLPRRGGGQGRLGDPQGAQAARARPGAHRLPDLRPPAVRHGHASWPRSSAACEAYEDPIEVAVLGCAVNGIGEASHADFGITGAKNEGLIFSRGKPLRKVPQDELVDVLFEEIDKYARPKSRGRRGRGRRGRRVAGQDRGRERRRADPGAPRRLDAEAPSGRADGRSTRPPRRPPAAASPAPDPTSRLTRTQGCDSALHGPPRARRQARPQATKCQVANIAAQYTRACLRRRRRPVAYHRGPSGASPAT